MNFESASFTQRISPQVHMLATLVIISLSFDFKGNAGGSLIQYSMAAINTLAFLLLAARYHLALPRRGLAVFVVWGWLGFLLIGSAGAMIGGVHVSHYTRTIYPYVLFIEGFLVAWWVARDIRGGATLISAMTITAVISFVFTFWWGFYFSGDTIETIRYQVLSPIIPFLIVVAGYDLVFASRHRLRSLIIIMLALGVIGLSVTRGMLLIVGIIALAVLTAWLWNCLRGSMTLPGPILRAFGWAMIIGTFGLLTTLVLTPDVVARWVHRGFGPAHSVTFWTRVAAVVGQWEQLLFHPPAWLFGRGFGQSYRYSQAFSYLVLPGIDPKVFAAPMWYPGEFMWITPLYYGGFVVGSAVIAILLWGAAYAFRLLAVLLRSSAWRQHDTRPTWVGVLGYFAFLGLGFTANPFIIRLSALYLGLSLGLVVAAGSFICSHNRYD